MRTFVFISNIPPSLLECLPFQNNNNNNHNNNKRDPRYELLHRVLADHTTGLMKVIHLENKNYGYALYASEEDALAACQAEITIKNNNHNNENNENENKMILRILEKERPPPPPSVYNPTITLLLDEEKNKNNNNSENNNNHNTLIVDRSELAPTLGLELYNKGKSLPLLCPENKNKKDCYYGESCFRLHLKKIQKTVRKRRRLFNHHNENEEDYMLFSLLKNNQNNNNNSLELYRDIIEKYPPLTPDEKQNFQNLENNIEKSFDFFFENDKENELLLLPRVFLPLQKDEIQFLANPNPNNNNKIKENLIKRLDHVLQTEFFNKNNNKSFFIRLSIPGGAPWDWSLNNNNNNSENNKTKNKGFETLKACCPYPSHDCPTALDRDIYLQQVYYSVNQLNQFHNATEAVEALLWSEKISENITFFLENNNNNHNNNHNTISLCIMPWVYLPTVGSEITVFYERGGNNILFSCQRRSALRRMTSSKLIKQYFSENNNNNNMNKILQRFAVLGRGEDTEAETYLEEEIKENDNLYKTAILKMKKILLSHHQNNNNNENNNNHHLLPNRLPWCAQFCLVEDDPSKNNNNENENENNKNKKVVLLSFSPYKKTLEESPMFNHILNQNNNNHNSILWNTQKHQYIPLLDRQVMERLK